MRPLEAAVAHLDGRKLPAVDHGTDLSAFDVHSHRPRPQGEKRAPRRPESRPSFLRGVAAQECPAQAQGPPVKHFRCARMFGDSHA